MFHRIYKPDLRFYSVMANILDQYEEVYQKYNLSRNIPKHGKLNTKLEDETPIFSKKRVNFSPPEIITHMAVSNDIIIIALSNNILLRINSLHPDEPEEIDLSKYSNLKLTNVFLDPTGQHCLLNLESKNAEIPSELLYLSKTSSKLKHLSKARGLEITAVAWNYSYHLKASSGPILLGTSKGFIFETEIAYENESLFQSGLEEYWKQVLDIGRGIETPITGMHLYKIPGTDKYFIVVTTANKLYQFKGTVTDDKPVLQQIFKTYLNIPEKYEIALGGVVSNSKLDFYYSNIKEGPKRFAWLTGNKLYYGQVDPSGEEEIRLENFDVIKFPEDSGPLPKSFVLTEFHVLLLYSDHVKGVSLLNQLVVFEDFYLEVHGQVKNINREPCKGSIWVFTEKSVFNYKVLQEDRNVWQIYTERGEFELAKMYCKDNPIYIDQVTLKQAEALFQMENYESSALYYSQTKSISFEEIALKFLQISQIDPLKTFLKLKLKNMRKEDKTQTTMIVIWLIELYLGQLGTLREKNMENNDKYVMIQEEFDEYMSLPEVVDCVKNNRGTVYDLMATHGDGRNLIQLTISNQDYERVIRHHIYKGSYLEALDVLKKASSVKKELFYLFAPTLIQTIPKELVQALIQQGRSLDPTKLLFALLMCNENPYASLEAIEYLEFAIYKLQCTDQALHNYLLSLYTKYKPAQLKQYLAAQGQDASSVKYDIHYALRLCQERGLTEACVQLSALLGLWESAVDLALTVSVDLAMKTANLHQSDPKLLKRLWLKIVETFSRKQLSRSTDSTGNKREIVLVTVEVFFLAECVIKDKNDIKFAMEFLKRSEILKIEDILPFFSDFVTIDDFKEAICTSLKEYNQHIQDLKEEMEEATKSAEIVLQKVSAFKHRYSVIKSSDTCSLCELQLLLRPFYIFPCGHFFHSDCMITELLQLLPEETKNKLLDLQKQLNHLSSGQQMDNVSVNSAVSNKDGIKANIDSIVATDCYFCGEYMLESIDKPFISDSDYARIMKEWE